MILSAISFGKVISPASETAKPSSFATARKPMLSISAAFRAKYSNSWEPETSRAVLKETAKLAMEARRVRESKEITIGLIIRVSMDEEDLKIMRTESAYQCK